MTGLACPQEAGPGSLHCQANPIADRLYPRSRAGQLTFLMRKEDGRRMTGQALIFNFSWSGIPWLKYNLGREQGRPGEKAEKG